MIFQEANLLPWRDLMQNILFPFEIKKLDPEAISAIDSGPARRGRTVRVREQDPARALRRHAAAGEHRSLPLIRSPVILMDEPFGALDAFTRDEMNLLIQKIWMETGKTIVFVTHNVTEAIFLADRVVVLSPRPGRLAHIFPIDLPATANDRADLHPRVHQTGARGQSHDLCMAAVRRAQIRGTRRMA